MALSCSAQKIFALRFIHGFFGFRFNFLAQLQYFDLAIRCARPIAGGPRIERSQASSYPHRKVKSGCDDIDEGYGIVDTFDYRYELACRLG